MRNLVRYLLMVLLSCWIISCSDTEGICEPLGDTGVAQVSFLLDLSPQYKGRSSSRTFGIIGDDFETWIQKGSLRISIFTELSEGWTYVGQVKDLVYVPLSAQEYRFEGSTSIPLKVGHVYRFMVMANCGTTTALSSADGPVFSMDELNSTPGYLPLWGITSHRVDFSPVQYLETVHLLRGVAKIEVKLSERLKEEGYLLSNVCLSCYQPQGYAFPNAWKSVAFTNEMTEEKQYFHPLHLHPEYSAYFHPDSKDASDYVIYVPEYDLVNSNQASHISLRVSKGHMKEDYSEAIEFKKYINGEPQPGTLHNWVRNHAYEYVIREITIGHHLGLESKITPWIVEEESWDYTDHVSVRSEGKMQWVKGTYDRIDSKTGSVVMIPGSPLVCTFQIDTPKKAKWFASFISEDGEADAFRFETFAINDGLQAMGNVGEPVVLHIKSVRPAIEKNNVARLRIVVRTQGGRTIWVKNLLPDEFQEMTEYTIVQSK